MQLMPELAPDPKPPEPENSAAGSLSPERFQELRQRAKYFLIFLAALLIAFAKPLLGLGQLSLNSELYSHVLLMPAISLYLVWWGKDKLTLKFEPARGLAVSLALTGIALLTVYCYALRMGWSPEHNDRLSLLIPAFLCCFAAGFAWCFGRRLFWNAAFPLAFLIFMVPLPGFMEDGLVAFLQHSSADVSFWMLRLSGMSVFREGTQFTMPGVSIGVAPECSGIRSSLVLFITGLLAAYFFLRKPWPRAVLTLSVIPLGIFRNALRIFTLSQLAVHVNPDVLNSSLHHHGGPLFFAVSLAPFFLLIWYLRKWEKR